MKWNAKHTKRTQPDWNNNQNDYDWDEEGIDDYSYSSSDEFGNYDGVEPEYVDIDAIGNDFAGMTNANTEYEGLGSSDGYYAQDEEYVADPHFSAGQEYASDAEYVADPHYAAGQEYARDNAYHDADYGTGAGYAEDGIDQYEDLGTYEDLGGYEQANGYETQQYDQSGTYEDLGQYDQTGNYEDPGQYDQTNGYVADQQYDASYDAPVQYEQNDNYEDLSQYGESDGYEEQYAYDGRQNNDGVESYIQEAMFSQGEPAAYQERSTARREKKAAGGQSRGQVYSWEDKPSSGVVYSMENENYGAANDADDEEDTFQGEITYIDDYNEKARPAYVSRSRRRREGDDDEKVGFSIADKIMAVVGIVVILLLAGVIGLVIFSNSGSKKPENLFASVGSQIQNIDVIGGKGIKAVATAEIAKLMPDDEPEETHQQPQATEEPGGSGYDETPYKTTISVAMNLTSVQKDLKIKFSNRETSKLIGNIRFVAQVTKPDGSTEEWVDSDMDGIIYEKGIDAGKYSVSLKALDAEKYSNYVLPATAQSINVKKTIEYAKVDVTGEGKKESEIDASKEDTKISETASEGGLTDTVAWVASTVSGNTYEEVLKSSVPDPLSLPIKVAGSFQRVAALANPDDTTETPGDPTPTPTPEASTPTPTPEASTPTPTPEASTPTPTPEASTPTPTPEASTPTPTPEASTPTPTPEGSTPTPTPDTTPTTSPTGSPEATTTPEPGKTSMELDTQKVELMVTKNTDGSTTAETATVKATVKGFKEGKEIKFEATSADNSIATVAIDANGKITVIAVAKGTTKVTVTADYKNDSDKDASVVSKVTKTFDVVVAEKEALSIAFDKEELLVYCDIKDSVIELVATIKNSKMKAADLIESKMKFTAETSDANVVQIQKKEFIPSTTDGTVKVKLTILPQSILEKKSCIISVKYEEEKENVTAKCTVTVKPHPKNDKTTPLKDKDDRQLFVKVGDDYRAAVYADFYVDNAKFYVQSGIMYTGWQTINGKTYYFTADGKYVTGEQVIQGAKYTFGTDGALLTGNGILGIDVSKWNGTIDWNLVKQSGVSFVIIRCGYRGSSQGSLIEDPKFASNIKGATNAGLKVGVYFFTQAVDEVEAVYEASYVIDKIKSYKITYPVFLDVEPSGGRGDKISADTRTKVCKAFCQTIQNSGYTAGIYANKTWLNEKMNVSELSAYKIWLAQYAAKPTYDGRYDIWQYKSTGTISGISGSVDLNLSYMGY